MCKVPTVEVTIPIGFVGIDILHGGFGEGGNGVGRISSRPRFGRRVGGALSEGRQGVVRRSRDSVAIVGAFLSLSTPFAFVRFAFSFALGFALAFGLSVKSVATPRGRFSWHVPILVQKVLLERGKGTLVESSVGAPRGDVRVKLGPGLN